MALKPGLSPKRRVHPGEAVAPTSTAFGDQERTTGRSHQRKIEKERSRSYASPAAAPPPPPPLCHPFGGPPSPAQRGARHEQLTEDREGQTREPPEAAEHRRTGVRIAAPASVLKPRPRFTVHDIWALPRCRTFFWGHPGPVGRTRRVKTGG